MRASSQGITCLLLLGSLAACSGGGSGSGSASGLTSGSTTASSPSAPSGAGSGTVALPAPAPSPSPPTVMVPSGPLIGALGGSSGGSGGSSSGSGGTGSVAATGSGSSTGSHEGGHTGGGTTGGHTGGSTGGGTPPPPTGIATAGLTVQPLPAGAPLEVVASGNAPIPYNLTDLTQDQLSIDAEFSLDGGSSFHRCTEGPGDDGTTALAAGTGNSYKSHTFAWSTLTDLGARFAPGAVVRITPSGHPPIDLVVNVDDRAPTASDTIATGPYLQATTPSSTKIVWRTTVPTDSAVQYGPGTVLTKTATVPGTRTKHVVRLTGLTPATTYSYRIVTGGVPETPVWTFRTAPAAGAPFTALVFGDSGSGKQPQFDLAALMTRQTFDLALHMGDVIYPSGEEKDYPARFFLPYGRIVATHPLFPAIGMHDQEDGQRGGGYANTFEMDANNPQQSKHYYSFVWGNTKFISIDTETVFSRPGPHMAWLEQELASSESRWLVVFMHAGLYSAGPHGDSLTLQASLQPLFERYKVNLLLSGHDHLYSRGGPIKDSNADASWPGFYYIVTAGGGAEPYRILNPHPTDIQNATGFHFVLLTFDQDAIHGRMVRIDGSTGDSFDIAHP